MANNKTTLSEDQIAYLLKAWKTKTLTQIAEEMGEQSTSRINTFYNKRGITPMTKRDLIAKELFKIRDSGVEVIAMNDVVSRLNVGFPLIRDIINEYGIDLKTKQELNAEKEKLLDEFERSLAEKRGNRSVFSVYTQSGSELTDELRGIKTTKREKTFLSNG